MTILRALTLTLLVALNTVTASAVKARQELTNPCAAVLCLEGSQCQVVNGKATCVPNKPDPCAVVDCITGTTCKVVNGKAVCVSIKPSTTSSATPPLETCGPNKCAPGTTCCNASCGVCVKPGMMCTQQACIGPQCGTKYCDFGQECCNSSCGYCRKPGEGCTKELCLPTGPKCGPKTCASGEVCCNASCGICTPPGYFCTQQVCALAS